MQTNSILCDACKNAIDTAKGFIHFQPLRGGLTFTVNNGSGNAGMVIAHNVHLCDTKCLAKFANDIASKIKPVAPKAETPAKETPAK